ncbi:hypothetical protein G6F32_014801 [Rhizopus arrhizus]|nr:hypothetical protein G6F32_014801 [Rhizopus arrhizus]
MLPTTDAYSSAGPCGGPRAGTTADRAGVARAAAGPCQRARPGTEVPAPLGHGHGPARAGAGRYRRRAQRG